MDRRTSSVCNPVPQGGAGRQRVAELQGGRTGDIVSVGVEKGVHLTELPHLEVDWCCKGTKWSNSIIQYTDCTNIST